MTLTRHLANETASRKAEVVATEQRNTLAVQKAAADGQLAAKQAAHEAELADEKNTSNIAKIQAGAVAAAAILKAKADAAEQERGPERADGGLGADAGHAAGTCCCCCCCCC